MQQRFTLAKGSQGLFGSDYDVPRQIVFPEQGCTQTEPDHFDFFLLVRNMLEHPARRRFAMGFARD